MLFSRSWRNIYFCFPRLQWHHGRVINNTPWVTACVTQVCWPRLFTRGVREQTTRCLHQSLVPSVAKCRVLSVLLSLPDQYPGKQTHPPPDIGECLRLIGLWWWVGVCEVASCCHVTREKQIDTGLVTCVTPGVITTVTSKQRPRPLITLKRPDLWPWRPITGTKNLFIYWYFQKLMENLVWQWVGHGDIIRTSWAAPLQRKWYTISLFSLATLLKLNSIPFCTFCLYICWDLKVLFCWFWRREATTGACKEEKTTTCWCSVIVNKHY